MLPGRYILTLVIFVSTVCSNHAWVDLETCDISCKGKQNLAVSQGRPGKSGPKGEPGLPGPPGSGCQCEGVNEIQEDLRLVVKAFRTYLKGNDWYESTSGNYYKVFTEGTSYLSAKEKCEKIGARLASTELRKEKSRREIVDAVMNPSKATAIWVGLDDFKKRLKFVWSDGIEADSKHSYWHNGEPNNSDNDERCGHFWFRKNFWGTNDENCGKKLAYMCQYSD